MKVKKAMLLASETLKLVLSLIGIALLVYLLSALYFSSVAQEKLKHAEATIEQISLHINNLKTNQNHTGELLHVTPFKWNVFSFVGLERKPNQCSGEDCLCICEEVIEDFIFYVSEDRQERRCSEEGACLVVKDLKNTPDFEIQSEGRTTLIVRKTNGIVEVVEK